MNNLIYNITTFPQSVAKYTKPTTKQLKRQRLLLVLSGLAIGVVNGLFGAGGGMLSVPALTYILGIDEQHAHATAIAVILPLCIVSSIAYSLLGSYEVGVVLPTVIGVAIGGIIGAKLLKKLSGDALSFIFYGLMIFAGLKMII